MTLRLDPQFPLVWRSPSSVQIGIDPPLVIVDDVTETQERLLAALVVGVSDSGLIMISRGLTEERESLIAALAPALVTSHPTRRVPVVAISGHEATVGAIAEALGGSGIQAVLGSDPVDLDDSRPDLAIAAAHFVLDPELHSFWLRRDVPHLPVVTSDTGVTIGPLIEPGEGPCLLCLELHRRDADAAWPAVATQLLGRRSRVESAVLLAETAGIVGRLVIGRLSSGPGAAASERIDAATGARSFRSWQPHPECGCRGIAALLEAVPISPGRRGSDWASAARLAPAAR